jgi:hypothetical protein
MNLNVFITYSLKPKFYKSGVVIEKHFFDDFFRINFLIKGNDFSCTSISLLNYFSNIIKQDTICFELKKNFIKKEIVFFYEEKLHLTKLGKKYKNFNIWHHLNWLFIKEKNSNPFYSSKIVRNIISIDTKNIHAWKFFTKSLSTETVLFWKILVISEILGTGDKINNSIINIRKFLFFFSRHLSGLFVNLFAKIFSWILIHRNIDYHFFLRFLNIKNSRNFFLLGVLTSLA